MIYDIPWSNTRLNSYTSTPWLKKISLCFLLCAEGIMCGQNRGNMSSDTETFWHLVNIDAAVSSPLKMVKEEQ